MPRFASRSLQDVARRAVMTAAMVVAIAGSSKYVDRFQVRAQAVSPHGVEALLDGSGLVRIAPGEFLMGSSRGVASEGPVHRVRITTGFEMGKFEVTQIQWDAVMRSAHATTDQGAATGQGLPSINPSHFKGGTLPVETVSWGDVHRFLALLSVRDPKHVYRLPTEAEWEYAASAGSIEEFTDDVKALAWFKGNSQGHTHPVGEKEPNAWGLYDMHGNVSEWVEDWYGPEYYASSPPADPRGPESGSYRVFRGCGWFGSEGDCRPALRLFNFPIDGYYNVGFRVVRTAQS